MDKEINKSIFDQSLIKQPASRLIQSTLSESNISNIEQTPLSVLNKANVLQIFFFQMIGMIIFTYGATCATSLNQIDGQITIAILLGICYSGFLCGANFNPVVTLMNLIRKQNKITLRLALVYFSAQIIGAALGASLGFAYNGSDEHGFLPQQYSLKYLFRVGFGEAVGQFILIFFILHLSNPNTTFLDSEIESYFMVCLFVYIGRRFTPQSGMSLNITVSTVFAIFAYFQTGENDHFKYLWIYVFGDILGAVTATLFYDRIYEPLVRQDKFQKKMKE